MSRDYETSILAYILGQAQMMRSHSKILKDYHFESTPLRTLAGIIFRAVEKHGEAPNKAECTEQIKKIATKQDWPQSFSASMAAAVTDVFEAKPSGITAETVKLFVCERETTAIAELLTTLTPAERFLKLPAIQTRLSLLTTDHTDDSMGVGLDIFGDVEESIRLMSSLTDMTSGMCASTGWPLVDRVMGGGHRAKEATLVLGPTGGCKTALTIQIARQLNLQGKRVIQYSIDSTAEEMAQRCLASQTGVAIDDSRATNDVANDMRHANPGHSLYLIRVWSPRQKRISDIKAHLNVIRDVYGPRDEKLGRDRPGEVDMIIIDTPLLMLPSGRSSTNEAKRFDFAELYQDAVALAKDEAKIVVCTHQANAIGTRAVRDGQPLTAEHAAEALDVSRVVGNIWGVAQTMSERLSRTFRMQFIKLRRPDGIGMQCRFLFDHKRQLVWPDPNQHDLEPMYADDGSPTLPSGFTPQYEENKPRKTPSRPERPKRRHEPLIRPQAVETSVDLTMLAKDATLVPAEAAATNWSTQPPSRPNPPKPRLGIGNSGG